ncbi:MAG: FAD-dependent oxidoreductase, partial [Proteobacteria bacterium]|nr:FAD-dependent oxidoreductase [Pseudomonadota bacterium]
MIMAGEDTCPAAMTERSISRKVRNDMKTISDQPNGMPPEYAQAAEIASKTLIEDGLVLRKQFNSWEEAEKLHLPEFAKALAFAREHVTPDPDTEAFYPVDSVMICISQVPQDRLVNRDRELKLNERGNLAINEEGETTMPGVFASGDVVTGAKTVVAAVA